MKTYYITFFVQGTSEEDALNELGYSLNLQGLRELILKERGIYMTIRDQNKKLEVL
jgi:hypothetical protein